MSQLLDENIIQMATQANCCVTAYVFHHFVDLLPANSPKASTSQILGFTVVPWVSCACGSLIDAIWIWVYQGDF